MNTASEEEEEDDSRSSDQEGSLLTVAMTTEPRLLEKAAEDSVMQGALNEESPKQPKEDGEGESIVGADDGRFGIITATQRSFAAVMSLFH